MLSAHASHLGSDSIGNLNGIRRDLIDRQSLQQVHNDTHCCICIACITFVVFIILYWDHLETTARPYCNPLRILQDYAAIQVSGFSGMTVYSLRSPSAGQIWCDHVCRTYDIVKSRSSQYATAREVKTEHEFVMLSVSPKQALRKYIMYTSIGSKRRVASLTCGSLLQDNVYLCNELVQKRSEISVL